MIDTDVIATYRFGRKTVQYCSHPQRRESSIRISRQGYVIDQFAISGRHEYKLARSRDGIKQLVNARGVLSAHVR